MNLNSNINSSNNNNTISAGNGLGSTNYQYHAVSSTSFFNRPRDTVHLGNTGGITLFQLSFVLF